MIFEPEGRSGTSSVREPFMAVGMVRLVQAVQARMLAARSVEGVCRLFLELFLPLFDAEGMRIVFASSLPRHVIDEDAPDGFRAGEQSGPRTLEVPLRGDGMSFGRIELYFREEHPVFDAPSHALLDCAATFLASLIAERLSAASRVASLTKAERNVLRLLERPTPEILDALGVSEATLRTHLKHLYRKLGVSSRREALRLLDTERLSRLQA